MGMKFSSKSFFVSLAASSCVGLRCFSLTTATDSQDSAAAHQRRLTNHYYHYNIPFLCRRKKLVMGADIRTIVLILGAMLSVVSSFHQPSVTFRQYSPSLTFRCDPIQNVPVVDSVAVSHRRILSHRSLSSSSVDEAAAEESTNDVALSTTTERLRLRPQAMAAGYSQAMDMAKAIQEAVAMAIEALPPVDGKDGEAQIDLAIVSVSSLYDGNASPATVVPAVLEAASCYGKGIQHLVGSTCGGYISSQATFQQTACNSGNSERVDITDADDPDNNVNIDADNLPVRMCAPVEQEGVPGLSVTLCIFPDVSLQTFHVLGDDVPDDYGGVSSEDWLAFVGISSMDRNQMDSDNIAESPPAIFLLPSPAFSNDLDTLIRGLEMHLPGSTIFGGVASTVSSLSRARLFRHDVTSEKTKNNMQIQTLADGCLGVVMAGDIHVKPMIAQGAKPVGGVYQVVKGKESTISAIALDEAATEMTLEAEALEKDIPEDGSMENDSNSANPLAGAYAKARIPKPTLAEANFLMKTLSDDDQAYMRKAILVGLDQGGSLGRTPSELARLAEGIGHNFAIHQVANASMKDGSVTLSLGCMNIEQGTRMRFFVRESSFAKREIDAIWTGYKKKALSDSMSSDKQPFTPTGCLVIPTLDRGNKFFQEKNGFETTIVSQYLPTITCISGFFSNGVIGDLNVGNGPSTTRQCSFHGSASSYVVIGSKSGRPTFFPSKGNADKNTEDSVVESIESSSDGTKEEVKKKAPRDSNGELIIKRREVHSGRALTVSTVEWSVAEKTALPSSALEGFMWEKETEVDRFRERVPLANLLSQCKLYSLDPDKPKPRDWIGPVKKAAKDGIFAVIPECKRKDPSGGSLRSRYNLLNLVTDFQSRGALALSVNCDGVLFGGSLDDVEKARVLSTQNDTPGPPILASDLILYPYQLYKLRLAGADAVNLLVGALATKDLIYLTKIAKSMQMQSLLTVTSKTQLDNISNSMAEGSVDGLVVSNRNLEDFSVDTRGQQALEILRSAEMNLFREKHSEAIVLAEGRIGIAEGKTEDGSLSAQGYIQELMDAGAVGAIVGSGLVLGSDEGANGLFENFQLLSQT